MHIVSLNVEVFTTTNGDEILTNKLNMGMDVGGNKLMDSGFVEVGSLVNEGDVLVGKLTPIARGKSTKANDLSHPMLTNEVSVRYIDSSVRVPIGIRRAVVLEITKEGSGVDQMKLKQNGWLETLGNINKKYWRRLMVLSERGGIKVNASAVKTNINIMDFDTDDGNILSDLMLLKKMFLLEVRRFISLYKYKSNVRLTCNPRSRIRSKHVNLEVINRIKIRLLVRRSIEVGDKVCGRHGNKGVISRIVPKEDMPYLADGTIIDIVINPLSIPSRMNIGQILEIQLGLVSYGLGLEYKRFVDVYDKLNDKMLFMELVGKKFTEIDPNVDIQSLSFDDVLEMSRDLSNGVRFACPLADKSTIELLDQFNKRVDNRDRFNQFQLYDGRVGLPFERKTTVGKLYVLKLDHLVDNKVQVRAIGPYSHILKQPVKGRHNKGGQRLGEMEVWTLQSYGVATMLKEVCTAKCDDILSRSVIKQSIYNNRPRLQST